MTTRNTILLTLGLVALVIATHYLNAYINSYADRASAFYQQTATSTDIL